MPVQKNAVKSTGKRKKSTAKGPGTKTLTKATSALRHQGRQKTLPLWAGVSLGLVIVLAFALFFYTFFVRPYSYRWGAYAGKQLYGTNIPREYQVHGIDVSRHQGLINWDEVEKQRIDEGGLCFVFAKVSEGGDHLDTTFARNYKAAGEHGFLRGAYHFYSPYTDAVKQADYFISSANLQQGDLPPVLDVEKAGKGDKRAFRMGVKQWLDRVESHYGVKPILYTSYKFKMRYLNDSIFDNYPYWIAHYYVDKVKYRKKWLFWQYTDNGSVPGIQGNVDLNVFNGTLAELRELTIK